MRPRPKNLARPRPEAHETETGLGCSNVRENEMNPYTDIFVITVIYGYESQRSTDQVQMVSVSSFMNFYEGE